VGSWLIQPLGGAKCLLVPRLRAEASLALWYREPLVLCKVTKVPDTTVCSVFHVQWWAWGRLNLTWAWKDPLHCSLLVVVHIPLPSIREGMGHSDCSLAGASRKKASHWMGAAYSFEVRKR
jgi:hypothetical protein